MDEGHAVITTLLGSVRQVKGPVGRVALRAWHGSPRGEGRERAILSRGWRGVVAAGAPGAPERPSPGRWDGVLHVREWITFEGRSPRAGHLHLFNLGTSGTCVKLAPSEEHPANAVAAGASFRLPSEDLLSAESLGRSGRFWVTGPPSSRHGQPERLLVVVTEPDVDLQLEDLHPKLLGRDLLTRCAGRGPAFGGRARVDKAKLFRIPPEQWDYGLLEMRVAD